MYTILSDVVVLVLNCTTALYLLFESGVASAALADKDEEPFATFSGLKEFLRWIIVAVLIILILFFGTGYLFFTVGSTFQSLGAALIGAMVAVKTFLDGRASYKILTRRRPPV